MRTARFASVCAFALVAAAGMGCSSDRARTARDQGTTAAERTAGETGRAIDDAALTTKVKSKMAAESRLASLKDVSVSSNNGVVTLTGVVPSDAYKKDVEQVARSVDGVTDVKNEIRVEKDTTAKERDRIRDRAREADRDRGDGADRSR